MRALADELLGLPSNKWLKGFEEMAVVLGLQSNFGQASRLLAEWTGVNLSYHSLSTHIGDIGQQWCQRQKQSAIPETYPMDTALSKIVRGHQKYPVVYVGMDGIMTPLNGSDRYKEAQVGVVFWESDLLQMCPSRREIREHEYVATLSDRSGFGELLFKAFGEVVGKKPCQVVGLGDGAPWIWETLQLNFPNCIEILDFFHLSEYVWGVARELFADEELQRQWAGSVLEKLKESLWAEVIQDLGPYKKRKSSGLKTALEKLERYLLNNAQRIDYKKYLQDGLMIGSGVVESSNKRVVSQRLKQSGMHWSKSGAQSMMALQAGYLSSSSKWQCFWQERKRTKVA